MIRKHFKLKSLEFVVGFRRSCRRARRFRGKVLDDFADLAAVLVDFADLAAVLVDFVGKCSMISLILPPCSSISLKSAGRLLCNARPRRFLRRARARARARPETRQMKNKGRKEAARESP
ncbi:hypothetical protein Dimus_004325, partial [Dionaea muscipula]